MDIALSTGGHDIAHPQGLNSVPLPRQESGGLPVAAALMLRPATHGGMTMSSLVAGKTYGTVRADLRKQMSGLEFVRGLADGTLPLNMIARTLGYDVVAAERGRVLVAVEPSEDHLNPAGTVHGGLAATLLDSAMGLAVQSTLDKGFAQTTVEFKISLV